jgi:hypothetical protein
MEKKDKGATPPSQGQKTKKVTQKEIVAKEKMKESHMATQVQNSATSQRKTTATAKLNASQAEKPHTMSRPPSGSTSNDIDNKMDRLERMMLIRKGIT